MVEIITEWLSPCSGCEHGEVKTYQLRAGGKGTAGTAMAVPVFEGEKMAWLGF